MFLFLSILYHCFIGLTWIMTTKVQPPILFLSYIFLLSWLWYEKLHYYYKYATIWEIGYSFQSVPSFSIPIIYKLATGTSTLIHMMDNHHLIEWEISSKLTFSPPQMSKRFKQFPANGARKYFLIIIDAWVKC